MSTPIGTISEITRYPIKSFAGEILASTAVTHYGLYGDRGCAFVDETKQGFEKYFTSRQIPEMLQYKAEWLEQSKTERLEQSKAERLEQAPTEVLKLSETESLPKIKVTSPTGRIFHWDKLLLEEMQTFSKRKLSMLTCSLEDDDLLAVDCASILIVSDASIRRMEQLWGKPLDRRRFRANLLITLVDDKPFIEKEWVNRHLQVGNVELKVDEECQRCTMVTIDPDNLSKDASLLKKIVAERNQYFGIYASVVKQGEINNGDAVYLI